MRHLGLWSTDSFPSSTCGTEGPPGAAVPPPNLPGQALFLPSLPHYLLPLTSAPSPGAEGKEDGDEFGGSRCQDRRSAGVRGRGGI